MENLDRKGKSSFRQPHGWMTLRCSLCIGFAFSLLLLVFLNPQGNAQEKQGTDRKRASGSQTDKPEGGETPSGVGVIEVPRADGGKDKIYFSTFSYEEEGQAKAEEKEKVNRSWDMLKNIIIDKRSR